MGNDMAGVLKQLGYDKVDVLGYSLGGGVAFQFAAQHPEMVRRLALVSTLFAQDGFYPEMLPQQAVVGAAMAEHMKETPMYKSYVAIAPHPEDFPKLLDQVGAYMRKSYDWSADVKKLTMPASRVYSTRVLGVSDNHPSAVPGAGGGAGAVGNISEYDRQISSSAMPRSSTRRRSRPTLRQHDRLWPRTRCGDYDFG